MVHLSSDLRDPWKPSFLASWVIIEAPTLWEHLLPTWRVNIVAGDKNMTAWSHSILLTGSDNGIVRLEHTATFLDKPLNPTRDPSVLHPAIYKARIRWHASGHAPADLYSTYDINPSQTYEPCPPQATMYLAHVPSHPSLIRIHHPRWLGAMSHKSKPASCTNSKIESNTASAI